MSINSMRRTVHLVHLAYFVDLARLACPVSLDQPNKRDKPNKPENGFLFVRIDNLWRALGKRTTFRRGAVRGPYVEDHGDQTDHDRAADCRPESRDRESRDQICG